MEAWERRKTDPDFNRTGLAYDWDYIGRAKFFEQLSRFEKFPNMKILLFEEYIKNTKEQFAEICNYLGISDDHEIDFKSSNSSFSQRVRGFRKC